MLTTPRSNFIATVALVLICSAATVTVKVDVVRAENQMRGLGIVAKLGGCQDSDERQLALIQELGADTVVFTPSESAANEYGKGQFNFNPETRYLLARMAPASSAASLTLPATSARCRSRSLAQSRFCDNSSLTLDRLKDGLSLREAGDG